MIKCSVTVFCLSFSPVWSQQSRVSSVCLSLFSNPSRSVCNVSGLTHTYTHRVTCQIISMHHEGLWDRWNRQSHPQICTFPFPSISYFLSLYLWDMRCSITDINIRVLFTFSKHTERLCLSVCLLVCVYMYACVCVSARLTIIEEVNYVI